jgi:hypothetical protein
MNNPSTSCWAQSSAAPGRRWLFRRSGNRSQYSSSSAYKALFHGQCGVLGADILHKTKAPPNCKLFVWLALLDQCWTGERLWRHHIQDDATCTLCSQVEETINAGLFSWLTRVSSSCACLLTTTSPSGGSAAGRRSPGPQEKASTPWYVLKECSNRVFHGAMQQAAELTSWIREEATMWVLAGVFIAEGYPAVL